MAHSDRSYPPTAQQILKQYFGFDQFRPHQFEIIQSINRQQDVLAVMPTGSGKSLCFQIPALMQPGTTLVISPLIALMKDQVNHLLIKSISAGLLTSAMTQTQQEENLSLFRLHKFKLFYVSPERLKSRKFLQASLKADIRRLIIDEAHCISEWGNDFRPSYRRISQFVTFLKLHKKSTGGKNQRLSLAAFTATATSRTQTEIIHNLQLKNPQKFVLSLIRTNLRMQIIHVTSLFYKNLYLLRLVKKHQHQNGIIYVYSRQSAQDIYYLIKKFLPTIKTNYYHAGLKKAERNHRERLFMHGEIQLLIATNAFGMGIDKANIRYVIHYQPSPSLENYYQEIGRAGRDGQPATVYLLHYPADWFIHQTFIHQQHMTEQQKKIKINKLKNMFYFVKNNRCRTQMIGQYFSQPVSQPCGQCDVCLHQTDRTKFSFITDQEKQFRQQLIEQRRRLAQKLKISPTQIATNHLLEQIAFLQPKTGTDLLQLAGVGQGNIQLISQLVASSVTETGSQS